MTDKYQKIAKDTKLKETCAKKKKYKTISHATICGKKHNQRIYKCSVCKNYHLTSRKFKMPKDKAFDGRK